MGLLTIFAALGMFGAARLQSETSAGRAQLGRWIGASIFAPSIYAIAQSYGLDPWPWAGDVVSRVTGASGK